MFGGSKPRRAKVGTGSYHFTTWSRPHPLPHGSLRVKRDTVCQDNVEHITKKQTEMSLHFLSQTKN